MFLNRKGAIPKSETTSVSRADIPSTSRNIPVWKQIPFRILDETSNPFPKFNAIGLRLLIKLSFPSEEKIPATHMKECITTLTNYLVDDVPGNDLVGLRLRNTENLRDKDVCIGLRRRD